MRRKASRTAGADEATIDMTSMLDVVFIMLIFFIVTTSFVKEAGIDVNRPTAASSDPGQAALSCSSIGSPAAYPHLPCPCPFPTPCPCPLTRWSAAGP